MQSKQTLEEANKAFIRRWIDVWNTQDAAAVDTMVAANYVRHDANSPEVRGIAGEKALFTMYMAAFPDLHITIEELLAEGDTVMARHTIRGRHQGELMGIPPTNRTMTIAAMEIYRIADGKLAEQWVVLDALGMMQQLGVIPAPGQAAS